MSAVLKIQNTYLSDTFLLSSVWWQTSGTRNQAQHLPWGSGLELGTPMKRQTVAQTRKDFIIGAANWLWLSLKKWLRCEELCAASLSMKCVNRSLQVMTHWSGAVWLGKNTGEKAVEWIKADLQCARSERKYSYVWGTDNMLEFSEQEFTVSNCSKIGGVDPRLISHRYHLDKFTLKGNFKIEPGFGVTHLQFQKITCL